MTFVHDEGVALKSERALRETIHRLSQRCAVVAIAHRLSTVREAGKIIVLREGEIEGIGTHDELMSAGTLYRRLVETQMVDTGDGNPTDLPGADADPGSVRETAQGTRA